MCKKLIFLILLFIFVSNMFVYGGYFTGERCELCHEDTGQCGKLCNYFKNANIKSESLYSFLSFIFYNLPNCIELMCLLVFIIFIPICFCLYLYKLFYQNIKNKSINPKVDKSLKYIGIFIIICFILFIICSFISTY